MLISSYINLPFGCWAYCQYPAVVEARTFQGKLKMGSDLLVWIGRLEVVFARDGRKAAAWSRRAVIDRLFALPQAVRVSINRASSAAGNVVS